MRERRACDSLTHFQGGELYLFLRMNSLYRFPKSLLVWSNTHSCATVYLLGTAIAKYARSLVTGGVACQGYTLSPLKPVV